MWTRPNRGKTITGAGHTSKSKIIAKCKSQHHYDNTPYHLDEHDIAYRKVWDGLNIFHAIMILQKSQPYILYESHNAFRHNRYTRVYDCIKRYYYWKKLHQN